MSSLRPHQLDVLTDGRGNKWHCLEGTNEFVSRQKKVSTAGRSVEADTGAEQLDSEVDPVLTFELVNAVLELSWKQTFLTSWDKLRAWPSSSLCLRIA